MLMAEEVDLNVEQEEENAELESNEQPSEVSDENVELEEAEEQAE